MQSARVLPQTACSVGSAWHARPLAYLISSPMPGVAVLLHQSKGRDREAKTWHATLSATDLASARNKDMTETDNEKTHLCQ